VGGGAQGKGSKGRRKLFLIEAVKKSFSKNRAKPRVDKPKKGRQEKKVKKEKKRERAN